MTRTIPLIVHWALFLLNLIVNARRWSRVLSVERKRLLKCGIFIENVPLRKTKIGVSGVSSRETTETARYLK
jgi:hypothetical protein